MTQKNTGWENWNIENVRKDLEIQNQWLKENIVQSPSILSIGEGLESKRIDYSFNWGNITSSYDSKSAFSSIFIKYNRDENRNNYCKRYDL